MLASRTTCHSCPATTRTGMPTPRFATIWPAAAPFPPITHRPSPTTHHSALHHQGSNYTYFINVCRPLASDPLLADTTCAKEGTGACQVGARIARPHCPRSASILTSPSSPASNLQYLRGSSAPKLAYNLGVGGDPKMDSSGTITIDYVGVSFNMA